MLARLGRLGLSDRASTCRCTQSAISSRAQEDLRALQELLGFMHANDRSSACHLFQAHLVLESHPPLQAHLVLDKTSDLSFLCVRSKLCARGLILELPMNKLFLRSGALTKHSYHLMCLEGFSAIVKRMQGVILAFRRPQ